MKRAKRVNDPTRLHQKQVVFYESAIFFPEPFSPDGKQQPLARR
jgi:hypothetical protein